MMGRILVGDVDLDKVKSMPFPDYGAINYVDKVSCKEVITYKPENSRGKRVVLIDCGVKANIIRCLLKRGLEVVRVP